MKNIIITITLLICSFSYGQYYVVDLKPKQPKQLKEKVEINNKQNKIMPKKYIRKHDYVFDRWCRVKLNDVEKQYLTRITFLEFKKHVKDRREPKELVIEAKSKYLFNTGANAYIISGQ